jgi:hypothetical protein
MGIFKNNQKLVLFKKIYNNNVIEPFFNLLVPNAVGYGMNLDSGNAAYPAVMHTAHIRIEQQ